MVSYLQTHFPVEDDLGLDVHYCAYTTDTPEIEQASSIIEKLSIRCNMEINLIQISLWNTRAVESPKDQSFPTSLRGNMTSSTKYPFQTRNHIAFSWNELPFW